MKIIGITGKIGCGKDTVADIIAKVYGFHRMSFAAPLKRGVCAMFDLEPELLERRDTKEKVIPWIGKSPRQLMQTLGTEWGRELVSQDIWLKCAYQQLLKARASGFPGVVISDLRFSNEAYFVRDMHQDGMPGRILHIERPTHHLDVPTHASESGVAFLPGYGDFKLVNDGGIDDLLARVAVAMRHWGWL